MSRLPLLYISREQQALYRLHRRSHDRTETSVACKERRVFCLDPGHPALEATKEQYSITLRPIVSSRPSKFAGRRACAFHASPVYASLSMFDFDPAFRIHTTCNHLLVCNLPECESAKGDQSSTARAQSQTHSHVGKVDDPIRSTRAGWPARTKHRSPLDT